MSEKTSRTGLSAAGKPRVLVLFGVSGRQLSAAGPMQSLNALMQQNRDEFDFTFVAAAALRPTHWADTPVSEPIERDGIRAYWMVPDESRRHVLDSMLKEGPWDLVVLNSFFDREFTLPVLLRRRFGFGPKAPILLSPRGEFAAGALSLKAGRKRAWLAVVRMLGLLKNVWLHVTADHERRDAEALRLGSKDILQAPVPSLLPAAPADIAEPRPSEGPLRIVFLGRVAAVKNLRFAIEVLAKVSAPVALNIFGPMDEPGYWADCQTLVAVLPDHVTVSYEGVLDHAEVGPRLATYDLFFLPTLGENFGHAIAEALAAGVPALIADTTPWRNLAASGAGWDLPLADPSRFVEAIEASASASPEDRRNMRLAARQLAETRYTEDDAADRNRDLLLTAMGRTSDK